MSPILKFKKWTIKLGLYSILIAKLILNNLAKKRNCIVQFHFSSKVVVENKCYPNHLEILIQKKILIHNMKIMKKKLCLLWMVNLCLKCIIIISSVTWNNCDIVLVIFWSNIYDCLNVLVVKTLHSFHGKKNLVPSHTGLKIEVHVCDHKVENCCFRMKLCLSIHKYCVHGLVLQVFKIKKWKKNKEKKSVLYDLYFFRLRDVRKNGGIWLCIFTTMKRYKKPQSSNIRFSVNLYLTNSAETTTTTTTHLRFSGKNSLKTLISEYNRHSRGIFNKQQTGPNNP